MVADRQMMKMSTFQCEAVLPVRVESAFAWHDRSGAFARLAPPWQRVEVVEQSGGIRDGARVVLRLGRGPTALRWRLEHRDWIENRQFRDVQVRGPFARWEHTHRFEPIDDRTSRLTDHIEYAVPGSAILGGLAERMFTPMLQRLFRYRHGMTVDDLAAHARHDRAPRLTVAISGSSGLIGSALTAFLTTGGHRVRPLVRRPARDAHEIQWSPQKGILDQDRMEGVDAVVHLAGENIASGRWTSAKKTRIRQSRVGATEQLCRSLLALPNRPRTFLSTSAVGFYGDRGDEQLDESSPAGQSFLAEVCRDWEAASAPLSGQGVRVVLTRLGMVLSPRGGALAKLLTPARFGIGTAVGRGRQYLGWITLDDVVTAMTEALLDERYVGPVNFTAPQAVTSRELAATLGRVLHRPVVGALPAWVARIAMGEMADGLLLASARVEPTRLLGLGYPFRDPQLELALARMLGRQRDSSPTRELDAHRRADIDRTRSPGTGGRSA